MPETQTSWYVSFKAMCFNVECFQRIGPYIELGIGSTICFLFCLGGPPSQTPSFCARAKLRNKMAITSNAGGPAVIATDAVISNGFHKPESYLAVIFIIGS